MTHAKDDLSGSRPFEQLGDAEGPSEATRRAIRQAVLRDLEPVPAVSMGRRALYVLLAGMASALLVVVSYGGSGLEGLHRHLAATVVAGVVAGLAALAIAGSFTPKLQARLGRSRRGLIVATLVTAWTLYISSGITEHALTTAHIDPALGCGLRSLVAGLVGFGAFLYIFRRTDPWTPRVSGALIGACAGIITSAGVGIPCVTSHGGHLFLGHWLAVPVLALIGALVARRVLEP